MQCNVPHDLKNAWVAEWSPRQKCFHVQTVDGMIDANCSILAYQSDADYIPIALCKTEAEARTVCRTAKGLLKDNAPKSAEH